MGELGHVQDPPSGPMPNGFDLTPTVNYAGWQVFMTSAYGVCVADGVLWCATGHVDNAQNPPEGPLPNGFDLNPTVNWLAYQIDYGYYYALCTTLVGSG